MALAVGTLGPIVSQTLPIGGTVFVVTTTPSVWPLSGSVLRLVVEVSFDGGLTFPFIATNELAAVNGGMGIDKHGQPILFDTWTTTLLFPDNVTRKMRLSANVLQACTVGITAGIQ